MLQRRQILWGIGALPFLVSACTETPIRRITPPNFSDLPKLNLAVGAITIEPLHDNRATYPHIEGLSPYPLQDIIRQWSDEVFVPVGGQGSLNIQILIASLIEEKLPTIDGLQGLLRNDQSEAYHGMIELGFQVRFVDFNGEINMNSEATRSVSERVSLQEREQVWVDLGVRMVRDIDQKLRLALNDELPRLLLAQ